ncbi:hypothetical protein NPIL_210111 [Nephila pilipes]|uniref:Uncharacterized protein n=1 Tax=Nephila pilipes TaxID=299642 RepID=A0A8X6PD09_NEPPI|nr:hypothetical protein NPIL_210111 [Nephila pilipes]
MVSTLSFSTFIRLHFERAEAVTRFLLTTGHDYLQAHFHRIGLAPDLICPLCRTSSMDDDPRYNCPDFEKSTNRHTERGSVSNN